MEEEKEVYSYWKTCEGANPHRASMVDYGLKTLSLEKNHAQLHQDVLYDDLFVI